MLQSSLLLSWVLAVLKETKVFYKNTGGKPRNLLSPIHAFFISKIFIRKWVSKSKKSLKDVWNSPALTAVFKNADLSKF